MPFRHPDRSHDLGARIEYEVRERLEEAVDYVCLEALVRARRARGLPPPAADSPDDRRAYTDNVLTFLRLLRRDITAALSAEEQRKTAADADTSGDEQARLIAAQVALARALPDYWQRFEAVSEAYLAGRGSQGGGPAPLGGDASAAPADQSGGEGRGLLARLFGRR
jgi:hypothetical protein